jgi:hypothetical protein
LFKAIEGKITAYTYIAEVEINAKYFFMFKKIMGKDNGPLLKMNKDNLEAILKEDEKALKLCNKKRYEDVIKEYNKENK